MNRFHFPTTIYFGDGSLEALSEAIGKRSQRRLLLVTDSTLEQLGIAGRVREILERSGAKSVVYSGVHPNPVESDVQAGAALFREHRCDAIVGLGGGSSLDAAKAINLMAEHPEPLAQYEDRLGGDALITGKLAPLYAIPTTAGTGSEVGRSAVITLPATGKKTILFSPRLMPDIAVLAPELTLDLPPLITAATGIDAFTHCLEAWLARGFHPMADGIALEGMKLCLENLGACVESGSDREARGRMLMAASMGATAFQKGLGMVHSLAHPLSARHGTHHGLANALLLPAALAFLERHDLQPRQRERLDAVRALFRQGGREDAAPSSSCRAWFEELGVEFGLAKHGIEAAELEALADDAWDDPCHGTNLVPVTREDLLATYRAAL